ncbi:MAG: hypothetical protein REI45_10155, partial [Propionicimonas sp.]|nr:hypothetical protein [Propionicimonas sp.]
IRNMFGNVRKMLRSAASLAALSALAACGGGSGGSGNGGGLVSVTPAPTPAPTPTVTTPDNPCPEPFVPRLSRPGDLTCVMPASAQEAQFDNREDIQRNRVIPGTDPVICAIPYEPRLAFPDDFVCVWEDTANRTHIENQQGYTDTPRPFNDKEYPETFTPRP